MKSQVQTTGEEKMNEGLLAWTTGGNSYALRNAPYHPGVDEELIAREEAAMALARVWTSGHRYRSSVLTTIQALVKKAELKQQAFDAACNPDVCHCAGGKQHCHLNTHDANNGRVITRSPVQYCENCATH